MREVRTKEAGDYAVWYRVRRRLLECVGLLVDMDKMTFWQGVPEDELDTIVRTGWGRSSSGARPCSRASANAIRRSPPSEDRGAARNARPHSSRD